MMPIGTLDNPFDDSNRYAFKHLLPKELLAPFAELLEEGVYLFTATDDVWASSEVPKNTAVKALRISFWEKYDIAVKLGKEIHLLDAMRGVMVPDTFYRLCSNRPEYLAYVLSPPMPEEVQRKLIMHTALERLMDIVRIPVKGPDSKNMGAILSIYKMLDHRIYGGYVNKNVQMNMYAKGAGDMQELEHNSQQLEELSPVDTEEEILRLAEEIKAKRGV